MKRPRCIHIDNGGCSGAFRDSVPSNNVLTFSVITTLAIHLCIKENSGC